MMKQTLDTGEIYVIMTKYHPMSICDIRFVY